MNLSRPPHIYAYRFSGMWAYGSHLRVEEKDTGKVNCDCVVSAEFYHNTGKNFYVGFIQEIIKVDYGETSPILLNCKWIKPSAIQHDEYGFFMQIHVKSYQIPMSHMFPLFKLTRHF